ncbi:MAG: hypothetical protein ACYCTV_05665 [Leptospirales bacterium]
MKYAFSNTPEETAAKTFSRVSTLRWPIEQCFQEWKSFLGGILQAPLLRDWKRHMILRLLGQDVLSERPARASKNLAASLPMIRTLVASVFSANRLSREEDLDLVSDHLLRNRRLLPSPQIEKAICLSRGDASKGNGSLPGNIRFVLSPPMI